MLLLPHFVSSETFQSNIHDVNGLAKNEGLVSDVIVSVAKWRSLCEELIQVHDDKVAGLRWLSVMEEVGLWGSEAGRLGVGGQLESDVVRVLIDIVMVSNDAGGMKDLVLLRHYKAEVMKRHEAASDAAKYLSETTPYLQKILDVANLTTDVTHIPLCIPPLFTTLRMVWTCSTTYGYRGHTATTKTRFWEFLSKVVNAIVHAGQVQFGEVPKVVGIDMAVGSKHQTALERSREHRRQKSIILEVANICTLVKETYYNTKLVLEKGVPTEAWDFPETDEDVLFAGADYVYETAVEFLSCLDQVSSHHEVITDLKQRKTVKNAALLAATLSDLRSVINDLSFNPSLVANAEAWAAAYTDFRTKSDLLTQLERKGCEVQEPPRPAAPPPILHTTQLPARDPTPMLTIVLSFNPPEISITGPIKETTVDALTVAAPKAFTTATSKVLFGKIGLPKFVRKTVSEEAPSAGYWYLRADSHFCDETAQCHLCCVLLDALELEGNWVLRDTNATYLPVTGDGGDVSKVFYKYFFAKRKGRS